MRRKKNILTLFEIFLRKILKILNNLMKIDLNEIKLVKVS